ncbi:NLR family CARD domain-containing protein 4 isoform X1 [Microcaecilia unicolor]|uniref:NLR family CARD domain-containing protein 4 n=1 Tax=Microcaecilia unicolor TaxID=1415580 RepID=A0A6P7XFQ7_9AMPH|nr:NLR family CARD domain-containing protein 4 isoform X1 [Microcaecilia unicolor]
MDFIKDTYAELVKRMGKCIVNQIVDDLFGKNVLSTEEMNVINDENVSQVASRKLILMVLNKGSESCNLFMKCLEKYDHLLFQDLCGSGQVQQKDLDMLVEVLTELYSLPLFQKFYPLGDKIDIDILFDLGTTFTDPLLWKKDTYNRRRGLITLDSLLNDLENPCIIEGDAGKGKTTLLKRIAMLWSSGNCPALTKFRFVFFISLSSARDGIYETLIDQLLEDSLPWSKSEFMQELRKLKHTVLFLLDGYDEFEPQNCPEIEALIKENHKFRNTVIVSTRKETIGNVRRFGKLIAETANLTEDSAKLLIKNVLQEEAVDLLSQLEESSFMKNLMKTPLFVVIACAIRMGDSSLYLNTQTALFKALYDLMVRKNRHKIEDLTNECITQSINQCGDLALNGVFEHRFRFWEEDFSSMREEVLLAAGLLRKNTAQRFRTDYSFFHTSFQEYTAGRRLADLLASSEEEEMSRGMSYLRRMNSVSEITTKYCNLLLYTCGSSIDATRIVVKHLTDVHDNDSLCAPSLSVYMLHEETENLLQVANMDSFVECGIGIFLESASKSKLSDEFEKFFSCKSMYINTQNISTTLFEFFKHLPNCLSALNLIKLDFFGSSLTPLGDVMEESGTNTDSSKVQTYIPKKAVSLFFDWNQTLQNLEVRLKDFAKLAKRDIKYLGKICCSAKRLRLHLKRSKGVAGNLAGILESCKNMQDLKVESTPLSPEDELRIIAMTVLKTLDIRDLQAERPQGLIDGMGSLVNIEKLIFDNIKMYEEDAKKLAEGLKDLKRLVILHLSHLTTIGNGMDDIVESICSEPRDLQEIKLVDCCLSGKAVKILAQNIKHFPKLRMLDSSENNLKEEGNGSVTMLVDSLNGFPDMTVLMLPCGCDVRLCLDTLLQHLIQMPRLVRLGLKNWHLTDTEISKLSAFFKENLKDLQQLDLSGNCVTSDGWLSFTEALRDLKELTTLDLSSEHSLQPYAGLVLELSRVISKLKGLQKVRLCGWQLDSIDLQKINSAKAGCEGEFQLLTA